MKIHDISQALLKCRIYPGDNRPERIIIKNMDKGDSYNLSELHCCVHNGTHVDAPRHFIKNGKGIDEIELGKFVGKCFVHSHHGIITESDAKEIYEKAVAHSIEASRKLLIKGDAEISLAAAKYFAQQNIDLLGNESQTIGPVNAPMATHLALLENEVVLLEGIDLSNVNDGVYLLNCAPINIEGCDGSLCRAILIEE